MRLQDTVLLFSGGSGGKKVLTLKKGILEGNTNLLPLLPLFQRKSLQKNKF
jgi:hypothetical protein